MLANVITLCRLILVFVVISLFGQHLYLDVLLVGAIGVIFFLDAVDGYIARTHSITSDFGMVLDIAVDRIVESVFWIYFTAIRLIPFWMPVIVISRGFLTDGLRSAAFTQENRTAFGENTMMSKAWTRALTCSQISRCVYGIAKALAFLYLGGVVAYKNAGVNPELLAGLEKAGVILSTVPVAMCLIRGLPVFVDGWKYISRHVPTDRVD